MVRIDRSSWVSWLSYYIGFSIGLTPEAAEDIAKLGPTAVALLGSICWFFVAVAYIQRYMRIALSANSFGTPQQLVTTGVFKYSRNPIYCAFLVPLACLATVSWGGALVGIGLYVAAMTGLVIWREEETLSRLFPDTYAAYCARTPRWIAV